MIELQNINFRYAGGNDAGGLENINLTIPDGQVLLLCGKSGCGKTTLTRLINGLIPNYYEGKLTGNVLLNGKNISQLPLYETAKYVGSVFQNPRTQFFTVDTTSELAFGCENQGLPENEIVERVKAAADSSSPIFAIEIISGTTRYSNIFIGLRNVVMPLIFIASRIAAYSSFTVGKKRNTTDTGMTTFCGTRILSMAATNSLTVVVLTK